MKKIFALILSLVLALALVGWAGEPAAENTAGADATQAPAESAGTVSPAGGESAAPAGGGGYKVAIGLGVGGKIGIARSGNNVAVAVFFGIGLLQFNEVAIGLGHRAI